MSRAFDTLTKTELEPLSPMFPGGPPRLGRPRRRRILPMILVCTVVVVAAGAAAATVLRMQRQMGLPPTAPTAGLQPELSPQTITVTAPEPSKAAAQAATPSAPDKPSVTTTAVTPSPGSEPSAKAAPIVAGPMVAAVVSPTPGSALPPPIAVTPAKPPVPAAAPTVEPELTTEEKYRDLVARGGAAVDRGALGEAGRLFRLAVKLNPRDPDGWNSLGVVLARQGNVTGGMDALNQALQVDGTFAPAHRNLGILLERQGRAREAIGHYRSFLILVAENHPDYDAVRQRLAVPIRRVPTP